MHSPSALTEHVSPNLAGIFLLDPVVLILKAQLDCLRRSRLHKSEKVLISAALVIILFGILRRCLMRKKVLAFH